MTLKSQDTYSWTIVMQPVTSGTPEDAAFWKATPGGELKMNVVNDAAAAKFEVGKTYYLDFSAAE